MESEGDGEDIPKNGELDNVHPRPISFYVPVNDSVDNGYKKTMRNAKSRLRRRSEENEDESYFKLNHDEKMLQADILYQDQLNEKGMSCCVIVSCRLAALCKTFLGQKDTVTDVSSMSVRLKMLT
jgi:hypothetical protein